MVVQANNLQMIVRAHECVMDGFERFAQGHLITLFSATNYCGTANNAGEALTPAPKRVCDGAEPFQTATCESCLFAACQVLLAALTSSFHSDRLAFTAIWNISSSWVPHAP